LAVLPAFVLAAVLLIFVFWWCDDVGDGICKSSDVAPAAESIGRPL
jgi:hypothetical protein